MRFAFYDPMLCCRLVGVVSADICELLDSGGLHLYKRTL